MISRDPAAGDQQEVLAAARSGAVPLWLTSWQDRVGKELNPGVSRGGNGSLESRLEMRCQGAPHPTEPIAIGSAICTKSPTADTGRRVP